MNEYIFNSCFKNLLSLHLLQNVAEVLLSSVRQALMTFRHSNVSSEFLLTELVLLVLQDITCNSKINKTHVFDTSPTSCVCRVLPLSIGISLVMVMAIFTVINLCYLMVLGTEGIITSHAVAAVSVYSISLRGIPTW